MPVEWLIEMDPLVIVGLSYAGKKTGDVLAELVRDILGPSAKAIGKGAASGLESWKEMRVANAKSLVVRAAEIASATGRPIRPVPPRVLVPLLERGSYEGDDTLRKAWARLLASAALADDDAEASPAFVQVLAELTPLEAWVLGDIFGRALDNRIQEGQEVVILENLHNAQVTWARKKVMVDNFVRLQLLKRRLPVLDPREVRKHLEDEAAIDAEIELKEDRRRHQLTVTAFGAAFLNACLSQQP